MSIDSLTGRVQLGRYTPPYIPFNTYAAMTWLDAARTVKGLHDHWPKDNWNGNRLREVLTSDPSTMRLVLPVQCRRSTCPRARFGVWCVAVRANGSRIATLRCLGCGDQVNTIGEWKIVVGDQHLPLWHDSSLTSAPCERCGSPDGSEEHHWAPRHLFDDAYEWPTSYLCRTCHTRWHRVVTPNMNRKAV